MINTQLNVLGYLKNENEGGWVKVNQRELMGVDPKGFDFILKIVEGVSIKIRVKAKFSVLGKNFVRDFLFGPKNGIIVPEVKERKVKKKKVDLKGNKQRREFLCKK